MTVTPPEIGRPVFTTPAAALAAPDLAGLPEGGPLPTLLDPEGPIVTRPSDDPLVPVEHRRIRVLANYWHAGWTNAIPTTWLRASVLTRLVAVADALPARWGLAIFDAWRPLELQRELYDACLEYPGLMALPSQDPATPPPHLTGGAVDLTLTLDGVPLAPGAGFDDTGPAAGTAACEPEPGPDRHVRRALFHAMTSEGFVNFPEEWWHFEHGTRRWGAVRGLEPTLGPAGPPIAAV